MDIILNIDRNIILYINEILPNFPIIQKIFSTITQLGDSGIIWIIIGIFLLLNKKTKKTGILMLVTLALGSLLGTHLLKNIFKRQRPFIQLNLQPFITTPTSFSFPSGHSLSSFIGATCIFYANKKCGIFAYILATLIALSRVILIVHYPSDVIVGSILGIIISLTVIFLFKKFEQYYNK